MTLALICMYMYILSFKLLSMSPTLCQDDKRSARSCRTYDVKDSVKEDNNLKTSSCLFVFIIHFLNEIFKLFTKYELIFLMEPKEL